jgi:GT2 family glycosyltransferase
MRHLSICIATHERPTQLQTTLEALALQIPGPDEIVISDSSLSARGRLVVEAFQEAHSNLVVKYTPSLRHALPWQRWWAFQHSTGDTILFLDDDVRLLPGSIGELLRTYHELEIGDSRSPIAGIGFVERADGAVAPVRKTTSLRERWLRIASYPYGVITPGGLTVSLPPAGTAEVVEVEWLWGGAMSYPRSILEQIGLLDRLVDLYEAGLGKGEDSVLGAQARKFGKLYVIAKPAAIHLPTRSDIPRANAQQGWRRGLWGSWGRAQTMRWMASNPVAYRREWLRVAALELARSLINLMRTPWRIDSWTRLAGTLYGTGRSLYCWRAIPQQPKS